MTYIGLALNVMTDTTQRDPLPNIPLHKHLPVQIEPIPRASATSEETSS